MPIQYNSYMCEVKRGDEVREMYLPFWHCREGAHVQLFNGEMWQVTKVIHQVYKVVS